VYDVTRGQPDLVGWFGEWLTETYNPGPNTAIGWTTWEDVYRSAWVKEWNMAVFVPVDDETILDQLSGTNETEGVRVHVTAIGWM
jgi:hypothetical protein